MSTAPAPPAAARRDLRALFAPESVAVVGASDDPVKWGNWLARGAIRAEHRRAVHLVNRRGGEILGRPAHRSLAELPSTGGGGSPWPQASTPPSTTIVPPVT